MGISRAMHTICLVAWIWVEPCSAQSVGAWQASGANNESVNAVRFTSSGEVIEVIASVGAVVIGTDTLPGAPATYLARYSAGGVLEGVVPVGAPPLLPLYLRRSALALTTGDTIHFAGTFTNSGTIGDTLLAAPGTNLFLATFTGDLELVRVRIIGSNLRPVALEPTADGDLVLGATSWQTTFTIGTTTLNNYGNQGVDILLAKLDRFGNVIWYDRSGGPGFYSDNIADVAVHPDGAITITGHIRSDAQFDTILQVVPTVNPNGFVARYDAGGSAQWVKLLGYEPEAVGADASGTCYVTGFGGSYIDPADIISGNPAGYHFLAAIDSTGSVDWVVMPDDGNIGFAHDLVANASGDVWVSGYHRTTLSVGGLAMAAPGGDAWMVFKTDRFGTVQWVSLTGSGNTTSNIEAVCLAVDDSCGIVVGGTYSTSGTWLAGAATVPASTYYDALTVLLDECGITTASGPFMDPVGSWSVAPNPASDRLRIHLPHEATGRVAIVDSQGRSCMERAVSGPDMTLDFDLSPGLYMVTWTSRGVPYTQRVVVR